jgi:hypothetical protein
MTKIADISFKNVTQFTYFGTTITNSKLGSGEKYEETEFG